MSAHHGIMKIGIDIMGGDYAPEVTMSGVDLAKQSIGDDFGLVLYGDGNTIEQHLKKRGISNDHYEIIHCADQIGMNEHPSKSFSSKPESSIVKGFNDLKKKKIEGFASAGNTGAMLVAAMHTVKSIPGIIRPCIAAALPKASGKHSIILDVGINPDARPDVLYQYGILGSVYAKNIYNIDTPRVGLLNIGSEAEKGNLLTKNAYDLMRFSHEFKFIGNVEGNQIFSRDDTDVIVCDGFVGNVVLKEAEAFYEVFKKRGIKDDFLEKFNFEKIGGTPILGINSNVVIGHGISNETAIKNMILHAVKTVKENLSDKIKAQFN